MLSSDEMKKIKQEIDAAYNERKGGAAGSYVTSDGKTVSSYGDIRENNKSFDTPLVKGGPIKKEYSEKTVDELIDTFYAEGSENDAGRKADDEKTELDLKKTDPDFINIPSYAKLHTIVQKIRDEAKASNGVSVASKEIDGMGNKVEVSSCKGACSGICVGSCIGFCNSCSGACTGNCSTACGEGCQNSCTGLNNRNQ